MAAIVVALAGCASTKPAAAPAADAPTRVTVPAGDKAAFVILWSPSSVSKREGALWLGYLMYRVDYRIKQGMTQPPYGIRAPTFDEEVWARDGVARTYVDLRQNDPELNVDYFDDLARVRSAGFVREYVWVILNEGRWSAKPSDLRTKEFEEWRRVHLVDHRAVTYGQVSLEPR